MAKMSCLMARKAAGRRRTVAVLALLSTPAAALAHGGGLELVFPAWFLGGFLLLWVMAGWTAGARLKWATTVVVFLAAGLGAAVADRWSDRSWPADVARKWILVTVVVPLLLLLAIKAFASRSRPRP